VTYDTSPDQLEEIPALIKEINSKKFLH